MSVFNVRVALPAVVLLGFGAPPPASAQNYTWNDPNTGVWSSASNWVGPSAPSSSVTTVLAFSASKSQTYTATNDLANPFLLNRLTLSNTGSGTITIAPAAGSGAIRFAGTDPQVVTTGSGAVTLSTPLLLGANTLFTGSGTGTVTVAGTVNDGGGGFGLTSTAAGTFNYTAAGASSISFLRVGSGTTRITAGAWTLTSPSTTDSTAALVVGTTTQPAAFTLSGGATLSVPAGNVFFGEAAGSTGTGTITGAGTTLTATSAATNTGQLVVGNNGTGSLTVSGGAVVNSRLGVLGRNTGSRGTVIVDGAGSRWTNTNGLILGRSGSGTLTVQGGAQVSTGGLTAGVLAGSSGTVTVTGAGSQLVTTGSNSIAIQLTSTLTVAAGGLVSGHDVHLGQYGLFGGVTIDAGTLTARNTLTVAQEGRADAAIRNGGVVTVAGHGFVGWSTPSSDPGVGSLTVTGTNSRLTMQGASAFLIFGGGSANARGDLSVLSGGTVTATQQLTFAQDAGTSSTSIVDAGTLSVTGVISLAQGGTAGLTVRNGGTAVAGNLGMGTGSGSSGTLTVTGAGSSVSSGGYVRLGGFGTTPGGSATLNVSAGGSVSAGGVLTLFGGGAANVNAGSLTVGGLTHGTAASIGNVNLSNNGALTITDGLGSTYTGVIGGAGSLTKAGAGTQTLTGANTFTGNTTVTGGSLVLSGAGSISASPVVTVSNGATLDVGGVTGGFALASGQTLRGGGTVTGAVKASAGSSVAPGTPGGTDDLVVNGSLTLGSGSILAARVNGKTAGTTHDQVVVTGAGVITLTGSTLTLTGGYAPAAGDVFTIIRNVPNAAITGTFANPLVPGDPLGRRDFGNYHANISYLGSLGSISGGHDVVVYNMVPVPEPASVLAVASAVGLAAVGLRRRLTGVVSPAALPHSRSGCSRRSRG
jgi:fibronectin-binding autotransporter adhesin